MAKTKLVLLLFRPEIGVRSSLAEIGIAGPSNSPPQQLAALTAVQTWNARQSLDLESSQAIR